MDIVLYIPERSWERFLAEGDTPNDGEWSGLTHPHCLSGRPKNLQRGDHVYFASGGEVRYRAPIFGTAEHNGRFYLLRQGGAEWVELDEPVRPFQGFRYRWWDLDDEVHYQGDDQAT